MSKDKIFTIRLPDETYEELQALAQARKLKVSDLVRLYIRLGLLATPTETEDPKIYFKDGDELRPVLLLAS